MAERANRSIQEYSQRTSMMGESRGDQDSQGKHGHISSMSVRSMFAEQRVQLTQSWKEKGFGSFDLHDPFLVPIKPGFRKFLNTTMQPEAWLKMIYWNMGGK